MPVTKRKTKLNSTDLFMNEVVLYGGLPMRRADVYRHALKVTGSRKAADMFAFSERKKAVNQKPITLKQLASIERSFKKNGKGR